MRRPPIGAKVRIHNFGTHTGTVVEYDPLVTVQGRKVIAKGWVKIWLSEPSPNPTWSGSPELIEEIKEEEKNEV